MKYCDNLRGEERGEERRKEDLFGCNDGEKKNERKKGSIRRHLQISPKTSIVFG